MLNQLRLMGSPYLPNTQSPDLDLLVWAQHFSMQTRLLDWTTNPLMALWFACTGSKSEEDDIYVYGLESRAHLDRDAYKLDVFNAGKTVAFQPRINNTRVNAQQGWFTLHGFNREVGRFVPLEEDESIGDSIFEITLPGKNREIFINDLALLGVNDRTVMPDLTGLCRFINRTFDVEIRAPVSRVL